MTREEAIQYIDGLRWEEDFPYTDTIAYFIKERNEAIDMAIEALTADAESDDLIIKGAKGIQDGLYNIKDGKLFKYKAKGGTVRTYPIVPSADAVEVVRCRDCKYKRLYDEGVTKYYYCALEDRPNRNWSVDDTDYCSWGERREPWPEEERHQ